MDLKENSRSQNTVSRSQLALSGLFTSISYLFYCVEMPGEEDIL